jgi:hypothetical protein
MLSEGAKGATIILTLPGSQADYETRSRKHFCALGSQKHSRPAWAIAGSPKRQVECYAQSQGLLGEKSVEYRYFERTAFISNHVRICVSSRKDTNRKETLVSTAPLPGGEQPCFTAETKLRSVRYLETVIGWSGLISAVADSLGSRFQLADRREKRWGTPELQGTVNDLNISLYTFLLSQIPVQCF